MDAGMKLELALRNLGRAGKQGAYDAMYGQATALANIVGDKAEELARFIAERLKESGHSYNTTEVKEE